MRMEKSEKELITMLKDSIAKGMIEELIEGGIEPEDDMVSSFVATILDTPMCAELLKAIGIAHFGENREVCLAISDFCGYLNDIAQKGHENLHG